MRTDANGKNYLEMADLVAAKIATAERDAFPPEWSDRRIRGAQSIIASLIYGITEDTHAPLLTSKVLARIGQGICDRSQSEDMDEFDAGACDMLLTFCAVLEC